MFDMNMLCKTGIVCLRVTYPHLIFDCICIRTIRTHMCCLLQEDLTIALKKVLSLCPIIFLPPFLSGGEM